MRSADTVRAVLAGVVGGVFLTACGGAGRPAAGPVVAAFAPVAPGASVSALEADAAVIGIRLHAFGVPLVAAVRGHRVVVIGQGRLPVPAPVLIARGVLQFRPALCMSAPYRPPSSATSAAALPLACSSRAYSLQPPALLVSPATGTSNEPSIPPDPALAAYPSSSAGYTDSHPGSAVLLPLIGGAGLRYLLGPSELDGSAVAAARAAFESPEWVVDVTLTAAGASEFDALARKYFHEIIGINLDGALISAPLTQPSQATFTTFSGKVQISGDFSRMTAEEVSADLTSGELTTPLQVAGGDHS